MKRTIEIKLHTTQEQSAALFALQEEYVRICNRVVELAAYHGCWNRIQLHRKTYYSLRIVSTLGSQMVCNSIAAACNAYKTLSRKKKGTANLVKFRPNASVHYDKRTYAFREEALALYTLSGRIRVQMILGEHQKKYLKQGIPKEAQLVFKHNNWFFNLVLDVPDVPQSSSVKTSYNVLGVDLGENVLAATSSGKLFSGKQLRHTCDKRLTERHRLQRNGSKSAKQRLRKISECARRSAHKSIGESPIERKINHQFRNELLVERGNKLYEARGII